MRTFRGRIARVRSLAYSPDGASLASAGEGGIIRIWDAREGRVKAKHRFGFRKVTGLDFSHDGSTIASASGYGGASFWSLSTRSNAGTVHDRDFAASSLKFRPDGRAMVTCGQMSTYRGTRGFVVLWDLESKKPLAKLTTPSVVYSPVFNPEGTRIAFGVESGIVLWDPAKDPKGPSGLDTKGHVRPQSPEGQVSPDEDRRMIPLKTEPRCLSLSPDGRSLAVTAGWSSYIFDIEEGRKIAVCKSHRNNVRSVCFTPDGRTLATASHDGTVRFWDVETGDERACYDWEIGKVDCAMFAPDGMTIAVGGEGGIVVWDVE